MRIHICTYYTYVRRTVRNSSSGLRESKIYYIRIPTSQKQHHRQVTESLLEARFKSAAEIYISPRPFRVCLLVVCAALREPRFINDVGDWHLLVTLPRKPARFTSITVLESQLRVYTRCSSRAMILKDARSSRIRKIKYQQRSKRHPLEIGHEWKKISRETRRIWLFLLFPLRFCPSRGKSFPERTPSARKRHIAPSLQHIFSLSAV